MQAPVTDASLSLQLLFEKSLRVAGAGFLKAR